MFQQVFVLVVAKNFEIVDFRWILVFPGLQPLVKNLFDNNIIVLTCKSSWPFIRLVSGMTLDLNDNGFHALHYYAMTDVVQVKRLYSSYNPVFICLKKRVLQDQNRQKACLRAVRHVKRREEYCVMLYQTFKLC